MENKYYSPEIKDLLMLQEVEYLYEDEWLKGVVTGITVFELTIHNELLDKIAYIIYNPYDIEPVIRIKHLDQEDIESLRFESTKPLWYQYHNDRYMIVDLSNKGDNMYSITDKRDDTYLFYGKIKNKSELKKVLKMIGYECNG